MPMKIVLNENPNQEEMEIVINCKPSDGEALRLLTALREFDKAPFRLTGVKDGKTHLVDPSEVLYIDTADKKTFLYTEKDVLETGLRLYEIEARLKPAGFFRASKSAILNIAKIRTIVPDFGGRLEVTLQSGERMFVSRQYAAQLKSLLGM